MTFLRVPRFTQHQRLSIGGAALLALGAAGGAGAVSLTRPTVEMAPTVPTAVAHLGNKTGVVTVRGRVAEVYGDRFVVQDASGRALVDVGRGGAQALSTGTPILVQGRYDDGQLRARYLVDASGTVQEVGPRHRGHDGPPPPPPGGPGAPPPPPGAGAPPPPGGPGAPPPPGGPGAPPPPPPGGTGAPPPPPPGVAPGAAGGAVAPSPADQGPPPIATTRR